MKLLLLVRETEREAASASRIGHMLREKGYDVSYIAMGRESHAYLRKEGHHCDHIDELSSRIPQMKFDEETILQLRHRYGLTSLRDLYLPEMAYLFHERETTKLAERFRNKALAYIAAFEKYFTDNNISCVVQNQGAEIMRRTAYLVAKAHGIPCIFVGWAPFPGRVALYTNELGLWEDLQTVDESTLLSVRDEAQKALDYLRNKRPVLISDFSIPNDNIFKKAVRLCRRYYLVERRSCDYVPSPWKAARLAFRKRVRRITARALYTEYDPSVPHVFLPLHMPIDSQITVRAPQFSEQGYVVGLVARSLPDGMTLYVKEHPAAKGYTSLGILWSILRSHENVRLIDPDINAHDIIANAKLVVVINSTVGWEALLYGKPVVVLGNVFYRGWGVTFDVVDLFDLRKVIVEALESQIPMEKVERFLHMTYAASYPGAAIGRGLEQELVSSLIIKIQKVLRSPS